MPGLLSPLQVKGLLLRNRIVMAPMASDIATEEGEPTDRHLRHYLPRAEGGVALIIVEHSYVQKSGRLTRPQLGIHHDGLVDAYRRLASAIKEKGVPVIIQITHAGGATTPDICGCQPVGPSAVVNPRSRLVPRELTPDDIATVRQAFVDAARRAQAAGFDGVEIHGAHGFLLGQFLSPITNHRSDVYGGSLQNRARFPLEVVRAVRQAVGPEYPLFYRLGATDGMPGGLTVDDARTVAPWLVEAGVDVLDISGGLVGSRPEGAPPGFFIPQAQAVKSVVSVPVIGVGGIKDPLFAEEIVRTGKADLVAIGRALLADPRWAAKAIATLERR